MLNPFRGKTGAELALEVLGVLALTLVFVLMCVDAAYAGGNQNHTCQGGHNCNEGGGDATANATADATAHAGAESAATATTGPVTVENAAAGGSASNEGNSLSVESNYEGGPADLVLIPNNNTESCLRVFGFSFGNKDGSGMFGFPWRSKACDYKAFAADADAQGNLELGWFWRCHMKSAYKVFKDKGESDEAAIGQCHDQMVGRVELLTRVEQLEDELEFERNERRIERENANASRQRIENACEQSKDRILAGCVNSK
jgi:hypothetical protein